MTTIRKVFATFASLMLIATLAVAQPAGKKGYTLRGKVEGVDGASKSLTVNHGKVEGWMDGMTMKYKVDNADLFPNVKTGDTIEATVYDGDYTLYKAHVVKVDEKKK
ncbi:MAG: copper-binding protein [Bryobacteraceae bacterium]